MNDFLKKNRWMSNKRHWTWIAVMLPMVAKLQWPADMPAWAAVGLSLVGLVAGIVGVGIEDKARIEAQLELLVLGASDDASSKE